MPLNLRRRQRQNVTDAKHAAGSSTATGPADTTVAEPLAPPVPTDPLHPESPGSPIDQPAGPVQKEQATEEQTTEVRAQEERATEDKSPVGFPVEEPAELTNRTTVISLGDGTPEGVALVLALSRAGHEVIAVEHDKTAVGLRLANLGAVTPAPGADNFLEALLSVAASVNAQAVLAARAEEMQCLAVGSAALEKAGIRVWTPTADVFSLCRDRSALYDVLSSSGLPVEKTGLGPIENGPVRGRQFSVDVISGRDFEVIAAVSSWSVVSNGEMTSVAETFSDARLLDLVRAVCAALRIEGPAVVQGYVSITGRAWLTEVRPGFSPLLPLAGAAGVDVVGLALDGTMGRELPTHLLTHRSGVRMIQYLDQVFEG
jgi:hypothetical protein